MWSFIKVTYTKRFKDMSPFGINKILEVKDIEILRSQSKSEESKTADLSQIRPKKL